MGHYYSEMYCPNELTKKERRKEKRKKKKRNKLIEKICNRLHVKQKQFKKVKLLFTE